MGNPIVNLTKGLTIGEEAHTEAEIRPATVGDMLDAASDGEKLCQTLEGDYQLLPSPQAVGIHLLRRQIVRIGTHPGPLTLAEIRRLDIADLEFLQGAALALEAASLGRARLGESSGSGAGQHPAPESNLKQ